MLHNLLVEPNHGLRSLYEGILTIIVNSACTSASHSRSHTAVSPYLKSICFAAANKLVHLLELFSRPKFLFAKEENHFLISLLLEVRWRVCVWV